MRILALADRPPHLTIAGTITALCRQEHIDLICTLGDLEHADLQELASITTIPKIGVYGNHCSGTYMPALGIINMHLRTATLNGIMFGGFQGSPRYKEGDAPMFTQEEATTLMQNFPYVDVFLSHAPPYGINDEPGDSTHEGFKALREYLDTEHPRMWLHGHTYPRPEETVTQHGQTRIEYVFGHKIIDF